MQIEHIPLLQIQRDLHKMPRGMERFRSYLQTMINTDGDDLELAPLVSMNPMGREHVTARLDEWLALDAEEIARAVVTDAMPRLTDAPGFFRHGLVIVDDEHGGWTNRYSTDASQRIGVVAPDPAQVSAISRTRHNWISTMLWVSEQPSAQRLRQAMLVNFYRIVYLQQHGPATTLGEILAQEGAAAAFAGIEPHLEADELVYSQAVLQPLLHESAYPIIFAALYGDDAAATLGYAPLGLSPYAGLAVAAIR